MRLIVTACTGHMGAIVCDLIEQGFENHTLAAKTSRQCEENGVDRCYRTVNDFDGEADCLVDFSNHEAIGEILDYCVRRNLPAVIATTGFTEEEMALIHEASKKIPLFQSANMSVGIALLRKLAKQTADLLGRGFSRCRITPEDYFAIVPYVMENMEQPLGDASAIAFSLGCLATAKNTKLCYSGEGSDEFFGGYNMYRNAPRYGDNLKNFYVGNTNIMKEDEKERILLRYDPENLPINLVKDIYAETEGLDPLAKMSNVDIQIWLEGDIYLNVDKMSTAAGLEIRMPLTDRRIFDIAARMPSRFKVNEEQNKVAFRTAAAKVLPEEIAFRKKLGFIVPIRIWLADERYNADVRAKLTGDSAAKFFRKEELQAIYDEYVGGNSDLWRKIWTIYTFLVWYDIYFCA